MLHNILCLSKTLSLRKNLLRMKKATFFFTDMVVRLFLHRLAAFYSPLRFFKVQ